MAYFTDEEIAEILNAVNNATGHTKYIGARYVPIFGRVGESSAEWDNTSPYEPLTIVTYEGDSYTSRQYVPTGVAISNTDYWVETGSFNSQIEAYRQEVLAFDGRITACEETDSAQGTAITNLQTGLQTETTNRSNADTAINNSLTALTARVTTIESDYFAVIGDSFSDGSTEWPSIVAENTGMSKIVEASAGSAFAQTSGQYQKQFITQLRNLKNNANWSKVKHLIVYGCHNDWADTNATATSTNAYIDAFVAEFESSAHKPKLTFVLGNVGAPDRNFTRTYHNYPTYINSLVEHCRYLGYDAIPAYAWLLGYDNDTVFNSDKLHPNSYGQKLIAGLMTEILNGTYTGFIRALLDTQTDDPTAYTGSLHIRVYDTFCVTEFRVANTAETTVNGNIRIFGLKPHLSFGLTSQSMDIQATGIANMIFLRVSNGALQYINGLVNPLAGYYGIHANTEITVSANYVIFASRTFPIV